MSSQIIKVSHVEYRSNSWMDLQFDQEDNCRSASDWLLRTWRSNHKNLSKDPCTCYSRKHEWVDILNWSRTLVCKMVEIQDILEDKNILHDSQCCDTGCLARTVKRVSMDPLKILELK